MGPVFSPAVSAIAARTFAWRRRPAGPGEGAAATPQALPTCPYLGVHGIPDAQYRRASYQHCCHSPHGGGSYVSPEHQHRFCLNLGHAGCPHYLAPECQKNRLTPGGLVR